MKIVNIIAGIIALISIIESFINPVSKHDILSIELNIWPFRIVWLMILIGVSNSLYKSLKKEKQLKES